MLVEYFQLMRALMEIFLAAFGVWFFYVLIKEKKYVHLTEIPPSGDSDSEVSEV